MTLELKRIFLGPKYTIGKLYIDGIYFCDTLEDVKREVKIKHETCIPDGTYQVIVNMSNRFKRLMPRLLNVPNFDGILIHSGNDQSNTSGCILVGKNTVVGKLTDSKNTFDRLFIILKTAYDTKQKILIKVY